MAGISVPQYEIFKIGTNKLKYSNWDLQITKEEAFKYQELISLFEAQEFRIMANKILEKRADTFLKCRPFYGRTVCLSTLQASAFLLKRGFENPQTCLKSSEFL